MGRRAFEHRVLEVAGLASPDAIEGTLNVLGREGWKLVSVLHVPAGSRGGFYRMVLRRELARGA